MRKRKKHCTIYLKPNVVERIKLIGTKESRMFSQMVSIIVDKGLESYDVKEKEKG